MRGLIGDRFLNRFFGGRSHRRKANPAGRAGTAPENDGERLTEREDAPEKEAPVEIEKTGEINQLSDPKDGSERLAGDTQPLAMDDPKE